MINPATVRSFMKLTITFLAIMFAVQASAGERPQFGVTPAQLLGLFNELNKIDGEITDVRLLFDKTAAVLVNGKRGWEMYVFHRADGAHWTKDWSSGALGNEFSLAAPRLDMYFSACGPIVFQFEACRKYECENTWAVLIYDGSSGDVARATSVNGRIKYSSRSAAQPSGCAKEILHQIVAQKRQGTEGRTR